MDFSSLDNHFFKNFETIFSAKEPRKIRKVTRKAPAFNYEKMGEGSFMLTFPVPGVDADDIRLHATPKELTIEVSSHCEGQQYVHKGFEPTGWVYTYGLRSDIAPHLAYLKNGVLHVELFKLPVSEKSNWSAKPYTSEQVTNFLKISSSANDA